MPFSHLLAMEVSRPWDIALLVTWFEQRKQKNQRKKADNYKICKAKGKAGPQLGFFLLLENENKNETWC